MVIVCEIVKFAVVTAAAAVAADRESSEPDDDRGGKFVDLCPQKKRKKTDRHNPIFCFSEHS